MINSGLRNYLPLFMSQGFSLRGLCINNELSKPNKNGIHIDSKLWMPLTWQLEKNVNFTLLSLYKYFLSTHMPNWFLEDGWLQCLADFSLCKFISPMATSCHIYIIFVTASTYFRIKYAESINMNVQYHKHHLDSN